MELSFERDPIAKQGISVIIPSHDAGEVLTKMLDAFGALLGSRTSPYEIIVVDDASQDGTAERLQERASHSNALRVIRLEQSMGYGVALKTGVQAAQQPMLFTMPAQAGFEPKDLHAFLDAIDAVDIVCGVRPGRSWWQRQRDAWPGWWFMGVTVTDPKCPVRLYRRSVFERWEIQSKSAFAQVEIIAKANFLTALISEVAISGPARFRWPGDASEGKDARRLFFHPEFKTQLLAKA